MAITVRHLETWLSGTARFSEMRPVERRPIINAKPMMNQGRIRLSRTFVSLSLPFADGQCQQDRTEHQNPDEFHQRAGLHGNETTGLGGGKNLRDGIDRQAGQHAILGKRSSRRYGAPKEARGTTATPQGGRKGNGGGNIVTFGLDDRCDRGDGGIAANGIAACDQHRQFAIEAEAPAECVAHQYGKRDEGDDPADKCKSGSLQGLQAGIEAPSRTMAVS